MTKELYPETLTEKAIEKYLTFKTFYDSMSYKEDYQKALDYAKKINGVVYTAVDGERNKIYYLKGWHFVNRIGFVVIKKELVEDEV